MSLETKPYAVPGVVVTTTWGNSGQLISRVTETRNAVAGNIVRLSNRTPSYGLKKLIGELPQNTFGFTDYGYVQWHGYIDYTDYMGGRTLVSGIHGITPPIVGNPWSSGYHEFNQRNLVTSKVLGKIKDMDVDLAVCAGEFAETRKMFSSAARLIGEAVRLARRGDMDGLRKVLGLDSFRSFGRGSKEISNVWLLLNYGIRPFVADLNGALKALEKGALKDKYYVVSAKESFQDSLTVISPYMTSGTQTIVWTYRLDTSVRVKYQVTDTQLATLTSLGLTNPFMVGWELTKLSFVVDWMIGVGNWLSSFDASLGKTFKDGSITQFSEVKCEVTRFVKGQPGYANYIQRLDASSSEVTCNRSLLINWPVSYVPGIKDKTGLYHLATSLALLKQTRG